MSDQLVPQKRVDKNGHAVTRWVKFLSNGEPGIKIPAPQSPVLTDFAESVFVRLFPDSEEKTDYLIDLVGSKWYFTAEFAVHGLAVMPPKTLKTLNDVVTGEKVTSQKYLLLHVSKYLDLMFLDRDAEDVQSKYDASVLEIGNALVFHDALENLASLEQYYYGADDYDDSLRRELHRYEVSTGLREATARELDGYSLERSKVNYFSSPVRKQKEAIAYVIASRLTREFVSERGTVDPSFVKLVRDNLDRQREIIDLVKVRGADDIHVLSDVLNTDTPSISSGML